MDSESGMISGGSEDQIEREEFLTFSERAWKVGAIA